MVFPRSWYFFSTISLPVLLIVLLQQSTSRWQCESANILAVFPYSGVSHFKTFEGYLNELSNRGHRLTVISHFASSSTSKYEHVGFSSINLTSSTPTKMKTWDIGKLNISIPLSVWSNLYFLHFSSKPMKHILTSSSTLRNILDRADSDENHPFDLVILTAFNSRLFLTIPYRLRVPFIMLSPTALFPFFSRNLGVPINPSYIPSTMGGFEQTVGCSVFWERLSHTLNVALNVIVFETLFEKEANAAADEFLSATLPRPNFRELEKNCSLVLVNAHFSLNSPKPLPTNVVEVAGLHIFDPNPLPADIETFINESEHGVVYFCMGSLLRGSSFPEEKRNAFLYAFSKIPQRVLWKWEGDELPGKSDKIMTSKWMPQRDILAHPKVKLFISHGGLLGTNEAVYEGVPILGIPIFGDQRTNVRSIEASGAGEMLDYNEISNEVVLEKIQRLINYPKYRENAEQLSRRYRDRPMPPLDTAVYWTEYVIRHKGAPHLRSPAVDMPWYQYLLLDVIAFVIFVLVATLVVIYYVLKFTLRILLRILFRIFTRKPNVSKTSKKVD